MIAGHVLSSRKLLSGSLMFLEVLAQSENLMPEHKLFLFIGGSPDFSTRDRIGG